MNELYARELAPDTGGGTVDLSYDFAGNLLRPQLQSGGALRYTHDAWNRLVKVELEDAEEDLHPRAEYEYNPLNWRTVERTDTNTTDSTHALDEMRVHLYDASWRLLESRIDSDFDPEETSPDFEEHTQLVWGIRYIDDIVSTRRDLNPSEEDGAEVRMFHATDAQFSSVAVLLDNGSLLERVAYSPYGVARHQWPADASGDGAVNSADLSIVLSSYGSITSTTYRSEADFNRDGSVDAADLAAVLSYAAALPEGTLSSPGIANRTGYCGYRFAPETEMYLARNRWLSPPLGRWIERDPLGHVDGANLYEYLRSDPVMAFDPLGLHACMPGPCSACVGSLDRVKNKSPDIARLLRVIESECGGCGTNPIACVDPDAPTATPDQRRYCSERTAPGSGLGGMERSPLNPPGLPHADAPSLICPKAFLCCKKIDGNAQIWGVTIEELIHLYDYCSQNISSSPTDCDGCLCTELRAQVARKFNRKSSQERAIKTCLQNGSCRAPATSPPRLRISPPGSLDLIMRDETASLDRRAERLFDTCVNRIPSPWRKPDRPPSFRLGR